MGPLLSGIPIDEVYLTEANHSNQAIIILGHNTELHNRLVIRHRSEELKLQLRRVGVIVLLKVSYFCSKLKIV